MTYKEFITLGFERLDLDDNVEFDHTGYSGYVLHYKLPNKITIEIYWSNFNQAMLYIDDKYDKTISIDEIFSLINSQI